jgi:hypothetical protein
MQPFGDKASISEAKLTEYTLSLTYHFYDEAKLSRFYLKPVTNWRLGSRHQIA